MSVELSPQEDTNRRMLRARDEMDRRYAEPLDVPHLAAIAHLKAGTAWISMGYQDPFQHYLGQVHAMYGELERAFTDELAHPDVDTPHASAMQRGATWTYLTTDEPFGPMTARVLRRLLRSRR